jgi:hypothetical protein
MVSKAIVAGSLILIIGVITVLLLAAIPSSAVTGGSSQVVCNLQMTVSGNYEDLGVAHWIGNFQFQYSVTGCHTQTILDLFPSPTLNIFPFTLTFTATLTDANGVNHCQSQSGGVCSMSAQIGGLQTSAPFSASTSIANVPVGQYTVLINSPFPINSYNGQTTYSQSIVVSQS